MLGVDALSEDPADRLQIERNTGVLFQDGALFGSMSLFDNIAFPLREHTKKKENDVRDIVMEKVDLVGLAGAEDKLPGEISGGMRKRAGLARALVLDPQIILCDEPDSGLDPVRTAYISQLLIDINAQIDATILIVTHNINIARTIPDNIGMLFRKELVMFGPREQLLTSEQPVVKQFLSGSMIGPIGMSEEKDADELEADWSKVKVVQAWGDETRFGNQDTDGSRSPTPSRDRPASAEMKAGMAVVSETMMGLSRFGRISLERTWLVGTPSARAAGACFTATMTASPPVTAGTRIHGLCMAATATCTAAA